MLKLRPARGKHAYMRGLLFGIRHDQALSLRQLDQGEIWTAAEHSVEIDDGRTRLRSEKGR